MCQTHIPTLSLADETLKNVYHFFVNKNGVLGTCAVEAFAFVNSTNPLSNELLPDIQFHYLSATLHEQYLLNVNMSSNIIKRLLDAFKNGFTCCAVPTLLHPFSRGTVRLRSSDPFDHPIIEPNYLSDERDVRALTESCKLFMKICQTEPYSNCISRLLCDIIVDNPCSMNDNPDGYWSYFIRHCAVTLYHPIGTCKMSSDINDEMSVTNERGIVRGVNKLRICDASIMPSLPSGNTNIPTILIAERISDFIKQNRRVLNDKQLRQDHFVEMYDEKINRNLITN